MKMLRTLFLAAFSFLVHPSFSQTVNETYRSGIELYKNNDIEAAIAAFKRAAFFAPENLLTDTYIRLGDCYLELKDYLGAHAYYENAMINTANDSLKQEIIFRQAGSYLLENKQEEVLSTLNLLDANSLRKQNIKRLNYYKAIAYYKHSSFDSSQFYFIKTSPVQTDTINMIFKSLSKSNCLSPKKARNLSIFLPGLGQLYAKDYRNSANSFLLNAGFLSLGVISWITYTPFDAILWVAPWWRKYYTGGYKKAQTNADAKLSRERIKHLEEILSKLQ